MISEEGRINDFIAELVPGERAQDLAVKLFGDTQIALEFRQIQDLRRANAPPVQILGQFVYFVEKYEWLLLNVNTSTD